MVRIQAVEETHPKCMQISRITSLREVVAGGKRAGDPMGAPSLGVQKGTDQAGILDTF